MAVVGWAQRRRTRQVGQGRGACLRGTDVAALAVVALTAVIAFAWHDAVLPRRASGDTYWYLIQAAQFAGHPPEQARAEAGVVVCEELRRLNQGDPRARSTDCSRYVVHQPARYVAIFTSRPGWPLMVAPFVVLLGVLRGVVAASLVAAVLAALLVALALRRVVGPLPAAAGGVAFSWLPTGWWAAWWAPEGATLAATALALLGATLVLQRSRWGVPLLLVAVVVTFACKPANGAAVSVALVASGLVLVAVQDARRPGAVLAGVGAAGLAGWQLAQHVLGLAGVEDTLQDLATRHFARPDVPDPWGVLLREERRLWTRDVERWLGLPAPFVLVLAAVAVVVLVLRGIGVVWSLVALSAVGVVGAHPMISQYDRLVAPVWLVVCAAVAVLVHLAVGVAVSTCAGARGRDDRHPAGHRQPAAPQEDP